MTKYLILASTVFLAPTVFGQTHDQLASQGDSLYKAREYIKSSESYQQAFAFSKNSNDLYKAACSAALAGDSGNALSLLESAFQNGWLNIDHLKKDKDLDRLHNDKKWTVLIHKMQTKIDSIEANYDKPLQQELLAILEDDQGIRSQYIEATKKTGYSNTTVDSLVKIMLYKDSVNLIKVIKILDGKGWVGSDKVGKRANQALFLVVQHSDLKIQEKYLPMMRDAVKKGNANAAALALLEDRVALGQGKKQIYGSQIYRHQGTNSYYVAPLEDPDHVDERRTAMGLGYLSDYVKHWNIVWNIEEYKKQLPELERLQKEMSNQEK